MVRWCRSGGGRLQQYIESEAFGAAHRTDLTRRSREALLDWRFQAASLSHKAGAARTHMSGTTGPEQILYGWSGNPLPARPWVAWREAVRDLQGAEFIGFERDLLGKHDVAGHEIAVGNKAPSGLWAAEIIDLDDVHG